MNNTITAQELKTKGAQALKQKLKKFKEVIITVRGKDSFVVLSMDQYEHLREYELEAALLESKEDISEGKFTITSVKKHLRELSNV